VAAGRVDAIAHAGSRRRRRGSKGTASGGIPRTFSPLVRAGLSGLRFRARHLLAYDRAPAAQPVVSRWSLAHVLLRRPAVMNVRQAV